jgi:hypothetical protein
MEMILINNNIQEKYLNSLVDEIKSKTNNKDDEARIAISLVQHIPYDTNGATTGNLNNKYPYEVVYSKTGVCAEKSRLLAFMLKELGYGVALFNYETESHMTVGIKCPSQYAYKNTGYCFVEADDPSIITYSEGDYGPTGLIKLTSTPDVYVVSDGNSFDSVSEEYNDAQQWKMIYALSESSGGFLDTGNYYTWQSLVNKYGIETKSSQVAPTVTSICSGQTCNGQCYESCPVGSTFKCDTTGATCIPNNAIECNGQYYTPCPVGYAFVCTTYGGICQ